MIPRACFLALALPVVFALTVLGSSAANGRTGRGPTVLSEREAILSPRTSDRSVAEVWLSWTEPAGAPGSWMTRDMLERLGFDLSVDPSVGETADVHYRRQLSRRAFVAFELDGPAWRAVVADRERQATEPAPGEGFERFGSRLVPVAVDPDVDVLAQRFPDPAMHLIVAATVRVMLFRPMNEPPYIGGQLTGIDPQRIQVPATRASQLPRFGPGENPTNRSFRISLMYGARWEPWVEGVESPK